jgi:uracil-DNA glycosylase
MVDDHFERLRQEIINHESNNPQQGRGYGPLFLASAQSKIIIIGQAPGIKAQTTRLDWDDASGARLMSWLGVDENQFRDTALFAHIPMDFYYPGKGTSGDLPPRKTFAPLWHKRLLDHMPNHKLIIPIGSYAQKYYLRHNKYRSLTETVRNYQDVSPDYFPLVHPSPLNFRWFMKNAWFESEVVPVLQQTIAKILAD